MPSPSTPAPRPGLQFSLQTLMIVMAIVAIVLGVYRSIGWRWLAYYYLLLFAVGPWFAYLLSECTPLRSVALRTAIGNFILLFLFIGALKLTEQLVEGPAVVLVGLAALLLWTPQYMVFFVWRGSLQA